MILQIGCNYHTTWQSKPGMRFVLVEIKGDMAKLVTRMTHKEFWTKVSDLIFIDSISNKNKAKRKKFQLAGINDVVIPQKIKEFLITQ